MQAFLPWIKSLFIGTLPLRCSLVCSKALAYLSISVQDMQTWANRRCAYERGNILSQCNYYPILNSTFLGRKETWLQSALDDPLPVYYGIKSILEIFTPTFFRDSDIDYETIRGELAEYLQVRN